MNAVKKKLLSGMLENTALIGVAKVLTDKYGSAEAVERGDLAEQVMYLHKEGSALAQVRGRLALAWFVHQFPETGSFDERWQLVDKVAETFADEPEFLIPFMAASTQLASA